MEVKYQLPTVEQFQAFRKIVGWLEVDVQATKTALQNSLFCVLIEDQRKLIGFGRIVGDGGLFFYIQDIIVLPERQLNGAGTLIIKELMSYIKNNAKPGAFVALFAATGLEKYYRKFGFETRPNNAPGMFQLT